jgi:hypothetical protein
VGFDLGPHAAEVNHRNHPEPEALSVVIFVEFRSASLVQAPPHQVSLQESD